MSTTDKVEKFINRVYRDVNQIDEKMHEYKEMVFPDTLQGRALQLDASSDVIAEISTLLSSLARLKVVFKQMTKESGRFELSAAQRAFLGQLDDTSNWYRSSLYAMVERSRSLREVFHFYRMEQSHGQDLVEEE